MLVKTDSGDSERLISFTNLISADSGCHGITIAQLQQLWCCCCCLMFVVAVHDYQPSSAYNGGGATMPQYYADPSHWTMLRPPLPTSHSAADGNFTAEYYSTSILSSLILNRTVNRSVRSPLLTCSSDLSFSTHICPFLRRYFDPLFISSWFHVSSLTVSFSGQLCLRTWPIAKLTCSLHADKSLFNSAFSEPIHWFSCCSCLSPFMSTQYLACMYISLHYAVAMYRKFMFIQLENHMHTICGEMDCRKTIV